jgi:3-oxoacyl-[acyl-carrier-protein] synthase II
MRRVVVTGMGLVSPLGVGVEHSWKALLDGKSGVRRIDAFDVEDMPCKIASMVPHGDGENGTYNPDRFLEAKEQRKNRPIPASPSDRASAASKGSRRIR